ncbi:MAG: hypothetical protein ACLFNK_03310 [Candidatus Woesearchaeota archaeon]
MGFFDKLKKFIEFFDSSNDSKIALIDNSKNNISVNIVNAKQGEAVEIDKENVSIDTDHLNEEKREELRSLVKDYVDEDGLLLEERSSNLLDELYNFNKSKHTTLDFFKDIIPDEDYSALKASVFISIKFKKGEQITTLKEGVIKRHGDRGKNICNLCTAGYFEEFLIPLYNSDKDRFEEIYEDLISNSMLAVFVNPGMKPRDIEKQITRKMSMLKKYGFGFIHIHGIGKKNISKIRRFIDKNKKDGYIKIEKIRYSNPEEHIFIAELILA